MADPNWIPAAGDRVRVVRELETHYRGVTFTVRDVRGTVRVDDGAHEDPDVVTNGARVSAWVAASSLRLWDGDVKETSSVRMSRELRLARAEIERLRVLGPDTEARVLVEARAIAGTMMEPAIGLWRKHAAEMKAENERLSAEVARLTPSSIHPSDCQACSEDADPCDTHAKDWLYWQARALDAEAKNPVPDS